MICYTTRCLQKIVPCFQRILRQDRRLYSLGKVVPSREINLDFPISYRDDKFAELRKRLAAIPHLKMLEKEEDRFRNALCFEKDEKLKDLLNCFSKAFNYNARTGKKVRTTALLKAFCAYGFSMDDSTWDQWDSEKWRSAVILAWCVELLQACYIVLDDIVDQSVLRRGQPCWHTLPDIGFQATYDAIFFLCGTFKVLERHFAGLKCYMDLYHEFVKVHHNTVCGESFDLIFNLKDGNSRFDMFTFEKYEILTEFKTGYYTFYLPVNLAMILAGNCSTKEFEYARELCLKLGLYYGIQNDHFDCYGKPELTGKNGNDIAEGKCTWFAVKFLETASETMKKEFLENYGADDKDAIAKVLELYRKTNLLERFAEFEAQLNAEIRLSIDSMNDTKGALFYDLFVQSQKLNSMM